MGCPSVHKVKQNSSPTTVLLHMIVTNHRNCWLFSVWKSAADETVELPLIHLLQDLSCLSNNQIVIKQADRLYINQSTCLSNLLQFRTSTGFDVLEHSVSESSKGTWIINSLRHPHLVPACIIHYIFLWIIAWYLYIPSHSYQHDVRISCQECFTEPESIIISIVYTNVYQKVIIHMCSMALLVLCWYAPLKSLSRIWNSSYRSLAPWPSEGMRVLKSARYSYTTVHTPFLWDKCEFAHRLWLPLSLLKISWTSCKQWIIVYRFILWRRIISAV